MSAATDSQRFAVNQVRELLAVDRSGAGEARRQTQRGELRTAVFRQPLHVRVKRRWRLDRTLRRRVIWAGGLVLAALLTWLLAGGVLKPVEIAKPGLRAFKEALAVPVVLPPSGVAGDGHSVQLSAPTPATSNTLPARVRLQRGDLWLRIHGARAAREARGLLESGLRELPEHARGQAALAQACLRLGDAQCAREAIARAIEARPQRSKFRELSRVIERRFAD